MSILKSLMVDTKSAWVPYPGLNGFEVEIANLSRPELIRLRKSCTFSKMDRRTRTPVESLDEDAFVEKFTAATVKNWKGLTVGHLENLLLVDSAGRDLNEEIPYSPEDAKDLVANSAEFDTWLNDEVFNLDNFRSDREGNTVETSRDVASE